jgi:hypothetical protein
VIASGETPSSISATKASIAAIACLAEQIGLSDSSA